MRYKSLFLDSQLSFEEQVEAMPMTAFVQIHLLCQLNPVPDQELISLGLWSPPSWITVMHLAIAFGRMWQL